MPAGRPRTTTPEKEELIELGRDLVSWAEEETKELRCRFCEWYSLKQGLLRREWDLMCQKPEFRVYYEQAQTLLAKRYIDGTISPSIAHRFIRIYNPDVKQDEDQQVSLSNAIPPQSDLIDLQNKNMELQAKLEKYESINNESKAESELFGSNASVQHMGRCC